MLEKMRAEIAQLQDEWFKETDGWWCYEKALQIIDRYAEQEPLTEEDYKEIHDRFGDYVEFVVRDMVSGTGERWTKVRDKKMTTVDKISAEQEPCDDEYQADMDEAWEQAKQEEYEKAYDDYLALVNAEQEPCNDTVSRGVFEQVKWERDIAIEQLHELGYELGQKIINGLPSVNPVPCDDVVSRQAVLDELNKWDWQELYLPIHFKENIIDVVPSVRPQEQTGHWTALESRFALGDRVECSECGQVFVVGDDVSRNYCPNCGARMESEVTE